METKIRESRHRTDGDNAPELRDSIECPAGGCSLSVLHVDDNADDRALVARELRRGMPEIDITAVQDEAGLNRALQERRFDLVITDYQLYWSDGLKVLSRLKQEAPGVPVVMFTGTGSEEVAVEAMKSGVEDYVLKSPRHFDRLRVSVREALAHRRTARELAEAEARYKALFDRVPVGLFRCQPNGAILDANAAFLSLAGVGGREELLERNFAEIHPEPAQFAAWREELEREGAVACVESQFRRPDGSRLWVEIHAKALRDQDTQQIYYEGSVEDISRRKQAEVERENLIANLKDALNRVQTLTGLLPICSSCKKIRDAGGQWNMLESYIESHSQAHFTHSFCPECARRLYPEIFLEARKA